MRIKSAKSHIAFGTGHEESESLGESIQTLEVEIPPIHDVEGAGLRKNFVQDIDVVHLAIADPYERGDVAPKIEECVEFDRRLGPPKVRPRKYGETQIDGCGIQGVDRLFEFDSKIVLLVERSGDPDQYLGKIRVNLPVPRFVGVGKCAPRHVAPDSHVIELHLLRSKTSLDVAQALPIGELSKGHRKKLIETGKTLNLVMPLVAIDATTKLLHGQVIHHLGENDFA